MSSVVSFKTNVSGQSNYSQRSDLKSAASGYSRAHSAYSQKRKEILAQEQKKEMDDLIQKQLTEQERHKKIMMDNKRRMKNAQDQLKKDLEIKKKQEEEFLLKLKEDKKTAYMKYLKENSKEILQNFKKKEQNAIPPIDNAINAKKNSQPQSGYGRQKPASADPRSQKLHQQRQGGHVVSANNMPKAGNVNNEQQAPKDFDKNFELLGVNDDFNLDALDLGFDRSTNNFKRIIDQYHKDMQQLKQNNERDSGNNGEDDGMVIPIEQFYDQHYQQNHPMQSSKLLESLDLSSSLTKWNPGKPLKVKEQVKRDKEVENNPNPIRRINDDYLSSYKNKNYEEKKENWKKGQEPGIDEEYGDEVEENIETLEEDSFDKEIGKLKKKESEIHREQKKLVKASEVTEKQRKQDWHLNYIDRQSQCSEKPPKSKASVTPKGSVIESHTTIKSKDSKSLNNIPNEEKKQEAQIPSQQNNNKVIAKGKEDNNKRNPVAEEFNFDKFGQNTTAEGFLQETGLKFKWADEVKDDDFYKDLNRQVPSREMNRDKKAPISTTTKSEISSKPSHGKPPVYDSARRVNALEADQDDQEYVREHPEKKVSAFPTVEPKKSSISQEKREVKKEVKPVVKEESVIQKSKPPSVISSNQTGKKDGKEKENQGNQGAKKATGLRSKLESHVKASQKVGQPGRNVAGKGGKRPNSPTTTCTRDTDLDVEEFIRDDFQMLNQEEANLQREILDIHRKEIGKVKQVEQKYNINTGYQNTYQIAQKAGENVPTNPTTKNNPVNEDALEESLERLDMMLSKQRNQTTKVIGQSGNGGGQNPNQKNPPPQVITNYPKETASLYQQVMQPGPSNQSRPLNQPPISQSSHGYSQAHANEKNAAIPMNMNPPLNNQQGYSAQGYINNDPYYANQQNYMQMGQGQGNLNPHEPVYSPEFGNKGIIQAPINPYRNPQDYQYQQYQPNPNYPPPNNYQQFPQQNLQQPPPNYGGYNPYGGNPYQEGGAPQQKNFNYPTAPQTYSANNQNMNNQSQYSNIQGQGQGKPPSREQVPSSDAQKEQLEKLKAFSFGNKNVGGDLKEVPEMGESLEEFEQFEKAVFSDQKSSVSTKTNDKYSSQNKIENKAEPKTGGYGYGDKKNQPKGKGNEKAPGKGEKIENTNETEDGTIKVVTNANLKHLLLNE